MFSEYGLFRLVGEWLLDLDQQVVCDGLCVLLNSVKTSPLFVKRAERLVTPAIVERLETFEDLSIQRKLAKFCARMIRLSKTPAFVRDMISRVEKLIHSTDIEVLDNILYDVCEGIASTKSDLLCQWARSLIQDLKSSRQDPPLKWICMIAGKLYEQGIDPGFQTKELLDMIQLEDKDLRKVVYWCLSCGVAKGRLDDNMILDYVLSLEVSIDNYGVAVECAYLCLVLLEKLTDQRLFEILDQHLVDRLVHFLMIEEGSVRAKVFQVLHRVSRSQLVIEEYNQGKMKTVLAELEKAQDLQEALEVRALIQAITGTTPVYEGESSETTALNATVTKARCVLIEPWS